MTIPNNHSPFPIQEHPQHWILNEDGDEAQILAKAHHGDLLIHPEESYRTEGVHFVCKYYDADNQLQTTTDRVDISAAAYYSVPLSVTRHIPDPIAFYVGYLGNPKYKIKEKDYHGIELDAEIHQSLLQQLSGGRAVHTQRKVYYDNSGYFGKAGVYIKPDENLDEQEAKWILLKPTTALRHLGAPQASPQRNPTVVKQAAAYKKKYETVFLDFLKNSPKGTTLPLQSPLPKEPKFEGGGMMMTSITLDRLEKDTLYAIHSSWDEEGKLQSQEVVFRLKIVTQYGRFGGVPLWVNSDEQSFIPLPYTL